MLTPSQQVNITLEHIHNHILAAYSAKEHTAIQKTEDWETVQHSPAYSFPHLMWELDNVYGNNEAVIADAATINAHGLAKLCRAQRTLETARCRARTHHPDWFLSNKMVGGVCYIDLFAGNLQGIIDSIPYFQELGLTYLHLMPLFKCGKPRRRLCGEQLSRSESRAQPMRHHAK